MLNRWLRELFNLWRPIDDMPNEIKKENLEIILAEPNPGGTEIPWLVIEGRWIDCPHNNGSWDTFEPRFMAYYPAIYSGMPDGPRHSGKPIAWIRATHWKYKSRPPSRQGGHQ